ncbi:MAG: hypothetical protein ACTSWY_08570 [Promethearchaeota archaeon]
MSPPSETLPSRFELEAKLFAIIKTIRDLQKKVKNGQFSLKFYHDTITVKINELLLIELIFKKKGMELESIINEMEISDEFFHIVPQIKDYILFKDIKFEERTKNQNAVDIIDLEGRSSFQQDSPLLQNTRDVLKNRNLQTQNYVLLNKTPVNPIGLAKISAAITSDFITILDFFRMELKDFAVMFELGNNLCENLKSFPGMEELSIDVSLFLKEISGNEELTGDLKFAEMYKKFESFYIQFKRNILIQAK